MHETEVLTLWGFYLVNRVRANVGKIVKTNLSPCKSNIKIVVI